MNDIADGQGFVCRPSGDLQAQAQLADVLAVSGHLRLLIGYAAGFRCWSKASSPMSTPLAYTCIGPLVGALVRPIGGWLADKLGGARVTFRTSSSWRWL